MSQTDLKQALKKLQFPECAKELLPQIESIIVNRSKQNLAMQLITEFIFLENEIDPRKGQPSHAVSQMSLFQEFQLIDVLIEYFSKPGPDAGRNAVFLSLFSSQQNPHRSKILCLLISTSISGSVASLLSCAGTWMHQMGCLTMPSLEVAQNIVKDFITFSNKTSEQLKQLPLVAPHFAANLIAATAELYLNDQRGALVPPPDALLDVFTDWVSENPTLCLASQQSLALPSGAIVMPVVTPLAGLIRWAVLAPLVSNRVAYGTLHLALLKTLLQIVGPGPPSTVSAQHLSSIAGTLQTYGKICKLEEVPPYNVAYQTSLQRFAQAVQVALSMKGVYGSIPQLLCSLQELPPHPLMAVVINANKSA